MLPEHPTRVLLLRPSRSRSISACSPCCVSDQEKLKTGAPKGFNFWRFPKLQEMIFLCLLATLKRADRTWRWWGQPLEWPLRYFAASMLALASAQAAKVTLQRLRLA